MKRVIVASILAFVLLFAFELVAYGEMAKERTLSGTFTYAGTQLQSQLQEVKDAGVELYPANLMQIDMYKLKSSNLGRLS